MITDKTSHIAQIPYDISNAYSFSEFVALTADMVAQNTTTGPVKSESRINATKLNLQRLNRVAKTMQLIPGWNAMPTVQTDRFVFLVITETWCGDGAQILPVIYRIAAHFNIPLQIILRDAYPDIADNYLFRGTRSIPKLIVFDKVTGKELGHWGPRPAEAQQIVDDARKQGIAHDDYVTTLQYWYNQNKTVSLQRELLTFMQDLL